MADRRPLTRLRDLIAREPKRGIELPAWLERILSIGIVSTDPDVVRRQRCVNVAVIATVVNTFNHLVINSLHDFRGLLPVNIYNVVLIVVPLLIPRLHRYGDNVAAIALASLVLIGHQFVVWWFGLSSDLQIYYTLIPSGVLLLVGVQHWRLFVLFFLLSLAALVLALNFAPFEGLLIPQDTKFRELLSSQALINAIAINAAILFYALTALRRAELELQDQYERSEMLIGTVMPAAIAARLKSGKEPRIADRIETLSVMFTDLVDFTGSAHDLPPDQVVDFLDGLVRQFDALCAAHGVEKIKTIGDSYMAAAGFDGRARDGAVAIGRLALALLAAIEQLPPLGERRLGMRLGIHCGPATAGVIGVTRFSYDVWGDAVNTASRLESSGMPGRIQVSEAYRALTQDVFVFEQRGTTDLKGVGAAQTFFLMGSRA
jgi:adenylate cyclase